MAWTDNILDNKWTINGNPVSYPDMGIKQGESAVDRVSLSGTYPALKLNVRGRTVGNVSYGDVKLFGKMRVSYRDGSVRVIYVPLERGIKL